jgi:TatD DNase family protein
MQFFNLHTHQFTNKAQVFELVNQYPDQFVDTISHYSIGIHPWYIKESWIDELKIIEEKLQQKNCLAIGECGLDKRIEIDFELQKQVFIAQIKLAEKHQKPIIVHCVAAFQEVIEIKKKEKITVPMVIHGFSKNWQTAKQLLDNEFYLSFGKYLLKNPDLKQVFEQVPNDKFFLETDTIEDTIQQVYKVATTYKRTTLFELQNQIETNFNLVFKL